MAYGTLAELAVDLKVAREERNDLQDVIYGVLKAYRLKMPTILPAGRALPILTPAAGHTPAPGGRGGGLGRGGDEGEDHVGGEPGGDAQGV